MTLTIKLEELLKEPESSRKIDGGKGWAEWRALKLKDEIANKAIAEWFYVVSCNKYYLDNSKFTKSEKDTFLVQENYDETQLFDLARDKISKLHFSDWDDFYRKMSEEFIYED